MKTLHFYYLVYINHDMHFGMDSQNIEPLKILDVTLNLL